MDNNTVVLSVLEDLVHWPLPPSDPTSAAGASHAAGDSGLPGADSPWRDEALLTAGGAEDLDEEPRERQRLRHRAVLRLPAVARALGPQWALLEVPPYLLRCVEEDDAELSFAVGMALIDFVSSPLMQQQGRVVAATVSSPPSSPNRCAEKVQAESGQQFSLKKLLPVVIRMGSSNHPGVRRFLVEVVIPMLFFGVSLEYTFDQRDWREKYLKHCSNEDEDGEEMGDEPNITFGGTSNNNSSNRSNNNRSTINNNNYNSNSNSSRGIIGGGGISSRSKQNNKSRNGFPEVWDPFQINLYANRIRSAMATFLRDSTSANSTETERQPMASCGSVIGTDDYIKDSGRREVFRARWTLFVGLMDSMLKSDYATTVSTAVECISNIFSSISWFERMERRHEIPSVSPTTLLQSVEELGISMFATTRIHVARCIHSGAERPSEDLMMILSDHHLIFPRKPVASSTKVGESHASIMLKCGGLNEAERTVWNLCDGESPPDMHRLVRISLLNCLPQLIDWTRAATHGNRSTGALQWLKGLGFFDVCDVFSQAMATPNTVTSVSSAISTGRQKQQQVGGSSDTTDEMWDSNMDEDAHNMMNKKTENLNENYEKDEEDGESGCKLILLESDVCRDFGVAEALLDGVQHLLDELLRPGTIKDFLQLKAGESSTAPFTLKKKKKEQMLYLCGMYRDCVMQLATLPSWNTRWLTTQRLPKLTTTLIDVLRRVGDDDTKDGPALVEVCIEFLCQLHLEQWSSAPKRGGNFKKLIYDEEEEVRCVVAVCAANVFRALAQGMFCLVFPRGVVVDMHQESEKIKSSSSSTDNHHYYTDPTRAEGIKKRVGSNDTERHGKALLSVSGLMQLLPKVFDAILSCCVQILRDPEERVRSGAAAGLSALARTLSVMVTACDLHLENLGKSMWLRYLDSTTMSLMSLLTDNSPTVQLALVSELAALLAISAAEMGGFNARIDGRRKDEAMQMRKDALVACLQSLSRHEVWRYRERYARLLSEMCVRFLAPNSLAGAGAVAAAGGRGSHALEEGLRERSVGAARPSGALVAEDGVSSLHAFAKEALLPLLVDVLFDKVRAVRDGALASLETMCDQLVTARLQLQAAVLNNAASSGCGGGWVGRGRKVILPGGGGGRGATISTLGAKESSRHHHSHHRLQEEESHDDDVFINDTLWPLIVSSPKAMATYLSRSSLLRIAVRLGVDKESILLPLLDQLGHDAVLNVRLVVAKEIYGILADSSTSQSLPTNQKPKVTFTKEEKNGVVLRLLRLLMEDKSSDVRHEAAKALEICF